MKQLFLVLIFILVSAGIASAQLSTSNARRLPSRHGSPDGVVGCVVGPPYTDTTTNLDDLSDWKCTSAPNHWTKVTSGTPATPTTPGGSNTQVQFNNSGVFGGSANLTWVSPTLMIAGATTTGPDVEVKLTGDTQSRVALGINTSDVARVSFGPGNAVRDLFLERVGAANLRLGAPAVDTAPVAQTLSVQNVLAGGTADVAGANFTIAGSQGKGTGAGGSIILQTAPAGTTGTSVNALVQAATLNSAGQLSVGYGTTAPLSGPMFTVASTINTSPRGILSAQFSSDTAGARVGFQKARGSVASPTTVVTGDTLGRLMFRGYDGTSYLEMGSIEVASTGTIGTNRVPTQMTLSTATDAATSVLTPALTIGADQKVTHAAQTVLTGTTTLSVGQTTSAATDLLINPATKASGNLIDAQVNGSSKFLVDNSGNGTFNAVLTVNSNLTVNGSSTRIGSFLKFNGTGATDAAWKESSGTPTLLARKADDSGDASISALNATFSGYISNTAPVTKTNDFTWAATENWIINNKSGSTCTATLPTASSFTGRILHIQNLQAQTVVSASSNVVPLGSTTAGTAILAGTAGKWATLVSDGTNWIIMEGN